MSPSISIPWKPLHAAITEEDLEFFTPPEDDLEEKMEDGTEVLRVFPMIFSSNDEPTPAAKYHPSVKFSIPLTTTTSR